MEKPILFSAEMVNAILDGRKTVTRRVIKPQPVAHNNGWWELIVGKSKATWHESSQERIGTAPIEEFCPHGAVGDTLWVRETFAVNCVGGKDFVFYRADSCPDGDGAKWKPSIFMPRKYSRVTLRITSVRAERLRDITDAEILAEGIRYDKDIHTWLQFASLWNQINEGRGYGWDANPWVWVVGFERVERVTA